MKVDWVGPVFVIKSSNNNYWTPYFWSKKQKEATRFMLEEEARAIAEYWNSSHPEDTTRVVRLVSKENR